MIDFKKQSFLLFLCFSFSVFGEEEPYSHGQGIRLSPSSFQKMRENPSSLKPYRIITKNKTLLRQLNKYFKKNPFQKKKYENFL